MMIYRNTWGSPDSGVDQQRADMFRVTVSLPLQLQLQGDAGANVWDANIGWAVSKFPFPDRDVETIPIKYLQQTNHQFGGDTASDAVEMTVRYAFNQRTATLLERWRELIASPRTGGVGLASQVKTNGMFYWLVPNLAVLGDEEAAERDAYTLLRAYELYGCWVKSLKPSDADMESGTGLISYTMRLQLDRYYPVATADLQNLTVPSF